MEGADVMPAARPRTLLVEGRESSADDTVLASMNAGGAPVAGAGLPTKTQTEAAGGGWNVEGGDEESKMKWSGERSCSQRRKEEEAEEEEELVLLDREMRELFDSLTRAAHWLS